MNAAYPVVCSDDIVACKRFYSMLFGFRTVFEADFYVHLAGEGGAQLGFVRGDHESVPAEWRRPAAGVFVTIEAEEVDALHERAQALGLDIASDLRGEPWGQRHFMVTDPNGLLVDVVAHIPPDPAFAAAFETAGSEANDG